MEVWIPNTPAVTIMEDSSSLKNYLLISVVIRLPVSNSGSMISGTFTLNWEFSQALKYLPIGNKIFLIENYFNFQLSK